jgi:hypothetical protein
VTSFPLNSVPDRCKSGPLAYYLPFILLTISGTFTQAGGGGSVVAWDKFIGALISSLEVSGTWLGSPVQPTMVLGKHLAVSEYVANGFRYATRRRAPFPAANGAYLFDATVAVPLSARYGRLISETSQLAKLYQSGTLKVNVAAASVITALSAGSSLSGLNARASAILLPRQEIVLGTPTELILHSIVAGGSNVVIQNFGRDTGLTGVKNKGGVLWLGELSTYLDAGAAMATSAITQFSFPWRDQVQTNHILALALQQHEAMINDRANKGAADVTVANHQTDFASFPYTDLATDAAVPVAVLDQTAMYAFPLVPGSNDARLTEVETASKDELYSLTVTGGVSNSHLLIGHYAKEWETAKVGDWVNQVCNGGADSLAAYVLGADRAAANQAAGVAGLHRRTPREKHSLSPDETSYLAWQML